jgi:4-hydroxy-tetrahydrodipicolinate synthase
MSVALLARIARDVAGISALKLESVPAAPKIEALVAKLNHAAADSARPAVLGGSGGVNFYEELESGAEGTIPGAAIPEVFVEIQRLHSEGERQAAQALFERYRPLLLLGGDTLDSFLHAQVQLLRRRGVARSGKALREPHQDIDASLDRQIEALADELGVEKAN